MVDFPQVPEVVKQANRSPWGVFFYVGVFFLIAAGTGQFLVKTEYTAIKETYLPFLFGIGAVLVVFCMFREWQTNKPKTDPIQQVEVKPAQYGFEVTEPKANVPDFDPESAIPFKGKIKRDPALDGLQLWYVMGDGIRYWPGHQITPEKNDWSFSYTTQTSKPRESRVFNFCLVGPNGRAVFAAYDSINRAHIEKRGGGSHEPFPQMTEDMIVLRQVRIKLK